MKKQVLAIAIVAGLGSAPLAVANAGGSTAFAGPAIGSAEVGHYVSQWAIEKANGRLDWIAGGVEAAAEGVGAALGGLVGGIFGGPVGMLIGAGIGAA